jgi:hypothetical protein
MHELAQMPAEEVILSGRHFGFLSECRRRDQAWFEATVAASHAGFSRWIGIQLGWRTEAAAAALQTKATDAFWRMTLSFDSAGGPFATDAQRILVNHTT